MIVNRCDLTGWGRDDTESERAVTPPDSAWRRFVWVRLSFQGIGRINRPEYRSTLQMRLFLRMFHQHEQESARHKSSVLLLVLRAGGDGHIVAIRGRVRLLLFSRLYDAG